MPNHENILRNLKGIASSDSESGILCSERDIRSVLQDAINEQLANEMESEIIRRLSRQSTTTQLDLIEGESPFALTSTVPRVYSSRSIADDANVEPMPTIPYLSATKVRKPRKKKTVYVEKRRNIEM